MTEHSEAWATLLTKHSEIREVPLDSVYVDKRFQRALSEHRKDTIKADYHEAGVGVITVAQMDDRDDTPDLYACIDGQTRVVALQELRTTAQSGGEDAVEVPDNVLAEVYTGLSTEEAALLFRLRNFQVAVPTRERDRIALTEGDPLLLEVVRQVALAGFTLFPADDGTAATMPYPVVGKRVVNWAKKYGRPDLLAEALTIQANAFGVDVGSVEPVVLQATANLLRKNPHVDEEAFTDMLRTMGTPRINAEALNVRGQLNFRQARATEFVLVREYNKIKGVEKIAA